MTAPSLRAQVLDRIATRLRVPVTFLSDDMYFSADLGVDSMTALELVEICELAFDVEIPERAIQSLTTVGSLARFVEAARGGA